MRKTAEESVLRKEQPFNELIVYHFLGLFTPDMQEVFMNDSLFKLFVISITVLL